MAENLQTTRPADEGWTTVIRPKTGWFDIDLQELWRYRDLIMMFVKRNFTVLYKQTILGPAWIILNPLITTVIFNVVFGGMANMPTEMVGEVLELMKELARGGMTMVCVTHEMGFAREVANRIIFIDEGIVKVDKPPKEFFANPENERLKAFLSKVL